MADQQIHGLLTIGTSNDDLTVAGTAVALTQGDYFLAQSGDDTNLQLVEHLQAAIRAAKSDANYTATYSHTTGKVTLGYTGTFAVTWDDTGLRDLLGFAGNLSGSASYTATYEARYQWRPDRPFSRTPVDPSRLMAPLSNTVVYRSKDGTTATVPGTTMYGGTVSWHLVSAARARIPSTGTPPWAPFEQFWTDCIAGGKVLRVYPDTTDTSTYHTVDAGTPGQPVGSWVDYCRRRLPNNDVIWDVTLPVIKHTATVTSGVAP